MFTAELQQSFSNSVEMATRSVRGRGINGLNRPPFYDRCVGRRAVLPAHAHVGSCSQHRSRTDRVPAIGALNISNCSAWYVTCDCSR